MNRKKLMVILGLSVAVVGLYGCLEPFSAPEIDGARQHLVFDGVFMVGEKDTSIINLSLTQRVNAIDLPPKVTGATMQVETRKGLKYTFSEIREGQYRLLPQRFDQTDEYRVRITTRDNKVYLSDYEPVSLAPPIDSIYYSAVGNQGINIYLDTHDARNKTRFYRWDYDETWQYSVPIPSDWEKVEVGKDFAGRPIIDLVARTVPVSTCYDTHDASNIVIGTPIKLSQDIIRGAKIAYVPAASGKLLTKYSVEVRQYGLTQKEYKYWSEMSKSTEMNGGLFDPLPSLVTGNIKSETDDSDLVFGFFGPTIPAKKRVFFTPYLGTSPFCMILDTLPKEAAIRYDGLAVSFIIEEGRYIMASYFCADCRNRGGFLEKPSYWR